MKNWIRMLCVPLLALVANAVNAQVAKIGETNYETLQAAFDAATSGQTIVLINDATLEASIQISKDVTFDLNGHSVKYSSESQSAAFAVFLVDANGLFTITDNSDEKLGKITTDLSVSSYGINAKNNSTVNFNGGTIENVRYGICSQSGSTVNVNGGLVSGEYDGVWVYGGILNLNDGKISKTGTTANYAAIRSSAANGVIKVSGGTVESTKHGIYMTTAASYLEINGGTIACGSSSSAILSNASGSEIKMSSGKITGTTNGLFVKDCKVEITGGEISGTTGIYNNNSTIDFKGGTISGKTLAINNYCGTLNLSGGIIKTIATAVSENLRAIQCTGNDKSIINISGDVQIESQAYGIALRGGDELTMTSGSINTPNSFCVSNNGSDTNETKMSITGGTMNGQLAIYHAGPGTLNVIGDAIMEGSLTGIEMRAGDLTIAGGSIKSTANELKIQPNGSGATTVGAAVAISQHSTNKAINVTVSGGVLEGMRAIYEKDIQDAGAGADVTLNITDGTFTGNDKAIELVDVDEKNQKERVLSAISGGTFSSPVEEKYCAEGYIPTALGDGKYSVKQGTYVAQIGEMKYESLADAFAAANDGETIKLLADCSGDGIKVVQGKYSTGLTVDFDGHKYVVDGTTVGSTGTKTNGFQLLKDNTITFKNGTVTSEKALILLQNYSNLTLEGMTLTLDNESYASAYTLSNNNGKITIDGTTINANTGGGFAFDVCRYASYPSVEVTVKGDSKINGNIEVFASNSDAKDGFKLMLESGDMTGSIVLDATAKAAMSSSPDKALIMKSDSFSEEAPADYKWVSNGNGTSTLKACEYVAQIGEVKYETLQAAVDAAVDNDVVNIISDFTLTTETTSPINKYNVNVSKNITINGQNHVITSSEGKRAIVLEGEGKDITIKDLTIKSNKSEAALWIASNLTCTLDNTTLDGTNGKTYNQPLTIGSIGSEGRVTLNITNNSVVKTNDEGTAHYSIIAWHPADINVTNSKLIGWSAVYIKPDAKGTVVKIDGSELKSKGISGKSNNFAVIVTESGDNTIEIKDTKISTTPASDTYQSLLSLNGQNNTVKLLGSTTYETTDMDKGCFTYNLGSLFTNKVYFDGTAKSAFEKYFTTDDVNIAEAKEEGVNLYPLNYEPEVLYYWAADGGYQGGYYHLAEPFENGWLDNGEFIKFMKNVTLAKDIVCQLTEGASFSLLFDNYDLSGNGKIVLNKGVTVVSDKSGKATKFKAAEEGYVVTQTKNDDETYSYTLEEATWKYTDASGKVTYSAALTSFSKNGTYQLLKDATVSSRMTPGILASNVVLDLNGHTLTSTATDYAVLLSRGGSATSPKTFDIVDTSENGGGKLISSTEANTAVQIQGKYNTVSVGKGVTVEGCVAALSENDVLSIEGTIDGRDDFAVATNGSATKNATISIKESAELKSNTIALYLPGTGTTTIEGGKVTGATAVYIKSGKLNITGGEITGNGVKADYSYNGNGANSTGNALVIDNCGYPGGVPEVSVEGGLFVSVNNDAVGSYANGENTPVGKFISGGSFSSKVEETHCAEGYIPTEVLEDGTYSVKQGAYVAQIGEVKYETLQEAVDAAGTTASTVMLLTEAATDNVVKGNGVKVKAGQNITFDLNGLTYDVDKTVGSTGTETNGFQLLKGSTVKFTNGTVTSTTAQILLQNYSNLTLDGVTVNAGSADYAVSNNFGSLTVIGDTYINAKEDGVAFDLWYGMNASYDDGVKVVFDDQFTGKVTGKIEYGKANRVTDENWRNKASLVINAGNFDIEYADGSTDALNGANISISGGSFLYAVPEAYCAEGYVPTAQLSDGRYSVVIASQADIVLIDGEEYTRTEDINVKSVTYRRTFKETQVDKYQAWYIPVDYTLTDEDIENFDFFKLHMVAASSKQADEIENTDEVYLHIIRLKAGDILYANRPYVIRPKSAATFDFKVEESATLKAMNKSSRMHTETTLDEYDFYGTYATYTASKQREFIALGDGKLWWNKSAGAKLGSYRWYMTITAKGDAYSNGAFYIIEDSEDVDGIDNPHYREYSNAEGIYTINGIKTDQLRKGINIIRMADGSTKKVVIK